MLSANAPRSIIGLASLRLLLIVSLFLACSATARADVILHAFNWRYADVEARAAQIQQAGYRMVLVAPAYHSEGTAWWARYQPQDYRVIEHPLGNASAFRSMVQALQARGIRVYADVLLNHMANESALRSDLNYPGQRLLGRYASNSGYYNGQRLFGDLRYNFLGSLDFGPSRCISNYDDVYQVQTWRLCGGNGDPGLPDLIANDWVVSQQQAYLRALKAMGVKGFRVDAAKHMPATHMNRVLTADIKSGMHVFGEVITSGGSGSAEFDRFLAPYLQATNHGAYDFPMLNSIRGAFAPSGSMSQLVDPGAYGQALPGARAITFTVTHDIPNNSGFRYLIMNSTDETLAYAYLLGRGIGTPMVYSDNNESGDGRWTNAWQRDDLRRMIGFHNTTQGSDMQVLSHGACHLVYRRGDRGIVGINKCGTTVNAPVPMSNSRLWWYTNYRDVLGGTSVVNISSASHTFVLPPRTARMWIR